MRFLKNRHVLDGVSTMFVYCPSRCKVAECLNSTASMMLYFILLITVFLIIVYIYIKDVFLLEYSPGLSIIQCFNKETQPCS